MPQYHFNTIDLTGKVFGKLTVLSITEKRDKSGKIIWECLCSCGNKHFVSGYVLTSGRSKSCGCLRKGKPRLKDRKLYLWKCLYRNNILKMAKWGEYVSDIDFDYFVKISQLPCHYCGRNGVQIFRDYFRKILLSNNKIYYNGIDRIDSKKGYYKNNIVPCCKNCNTAKNSLTQKEFKKLILNIHNNWAEHS